MTSADSLNHDHYAGIWYVLFQSVWKVLIRSYSVHEKLRSILLRFFNNLLRTEKRIWNITSKSIGLLNVLFFNSEETFFIQSQSSGRKLLSVPCILRFCFEEEIINFLTNSNSKFFE